MVRIALDSADELPSPTEHQVVEFACVAPPACELTLTVDGVTLEPFLRPGDASWYWQWNPGAAVGTHRVVLRYVWSDRRADERTWQLYVAPRKLDQERYELLLASIQRVGYALLYRLASTANVGAVLQPEPPWQRSPLEEYFTLFEERLDSFGRAVERIAGRPREQLRASRDTTPLGQATQLDTDALAQLGQGPFDEAPPGVADALQTALRPEGGLLPREVPTHTSHSSTDTYEHRLLKHLLGLLLRRARLLGQLASREAERLAASDLPNSTRLARVRSIAVGCADAEQRLRAWRALPFLAEVRPLPSFRGPTSLLQRDPSYREVYRMWMAQRQPPFVAFDSPHFHLPIADLPRLYEIWCTLEVAQALLELGGTVLHQSLIQHPRVESGLDAALELSEREPLLVVQHGQRTFTLRYQPQYRPQRAKVAQNELVSLDRHVRVPDIAIEITQPDTPIQVIVFDAKYRLDVNGRYVPQDALADAYSYFGAIGYANTRATIYAWLLYPGNSKEIVEKYTSGVGAIALLPEGVEMLKSSLRAIIMETDAQLHRDDQR